jgi:tRNA(Ile)-lysidine synthase
MCEKLIQQVKSYCGENNLIEKRDRILLAVSGGPDSVALLHIMNSLKNELDFHIAVFHVEHGMRGQESREDQQFVKNLCKSLGVEQYTKNVNVRIERKKEESLEEAARRVRYQILIETSNLLGFNKIATGHTLDDNVETILFRMITGTGPSGFAGILPISGKIIHPLLCIKKEDILQCLKAESIPFRIDRTNYDNHIYRNKIRNKVIPILQSVNNSFKEHIINLTRIIHDEDNLLKKHIEDILNTLRLRVNEENVIIDRAKFLALDDALKRRIIIHIITSSDFFIQQTYVPFKVVDLVIKDRSPTNKILYYNDLFLVRKEYGDLIFEKRVVRENIKKYLYSVDRCSGDITIDEIQRDIRFTCQETVKFFENNKIYIDYDKLVFPLIIRSRRKGDRIDLENVGSKKLKKIFIDDKVPREMREAVPVVESNNEIVGVFCSFYGRANRISRSTRVTGSTKKILVCELM